MRDSFEQIVYALGHAVMRPGLGHSELLVAVLVACLLAGGALVQALGKPDPDAPEWWERRS